MSARIRRIAFVAFCLSTSFFALNILCGCAGSVVGDAENVLTVISLGISTLGGVFAFIKVPTAVTTALQEAGATLATLQQLFAEYKVSATETTYQKIKDFVTLLQQNLQALLNPEGVSSTLVSKVSSIVGMIITQVGTWLALITQLQSSPAPAPAAAEADVAIAPVTSHAEPVPVETINTIKPISAKALHAQLKTVVETPTGDATIDWAFNTASRF